MHIICEISGTDIGPDWSEANIQKVLGALVLSKVRQSGCRVHDIIVGKDEPEKLRGLVNNWNDMVKADLVSALYDVFRSTGQDWPMSPAHAATRLPVESKETARIVAAAKNLNGELDPDGNFLVRLYGIADSWDYWTTILRDHTRDRIVQNPDSFVAAQVDFV